MDHLIISLQNLVMDSLGSMATHIEKLPKSGSDRTYFRLLCSDKPYIACHNLHVRENETFLYFTEVFRSQSIPVPEILGVSEDKTLYLLSDNGQRNLLDLLMAEGHSPLVYQKFAQSLTELARLQILGHPAIDYSHCLTALSFGKEAILSDLLYCKYYFFDTLKQPYEKQRLMNEFEELAAFLAEDTEQYFLFRDFQSRNILLDESGALCFIDYQGGMQGALQYDVASLLWQAKAELSAEWRQALLEHYMEVVESLLGRSLDRDVFVRQYQGYVLIRLMQVLGAYGFRGLFERKAHFLSSIPLALKNLRQYLTEHPLPLELPEFHKMLTHVTGEEVIEHFTPVVAGPECPLVVEINSFSYRKGYPVCMTDNGGGFVFDVRAILNPYRFEGLKYMTGQDKPIHDFFEQRTKMPDYLNSVWDLIDISIENYIERGFAHLQINFGCTGGQHRSVYAAEQTARHLRNKYRVKVELSHNNSHNWSLGPE